MWRGDDEGKVAGDVFRVVAAPPVGGAWGITGEIWNVEPCFHGGEMVYVGNIFKDPIIRGKENPYFVRVRNGEHRNE